MTEDAWDWWRAKLRGEPVQMNESNPHAGFYRWERRTRYGGPRTFTPVAYWPGPNGELNCRVGDNDVTPQTGRDIWVSVGNHPVSEDSYRRVAERGEPWPDTHPDTQPPAIGDNRPPPDANALHDLVRPLAIDAKLRLDGPPIEIQDDADRIADLARKLAELHKQIEEAQTAEEIPHREALAKVEKRWAPVLAMAEVFKDLKRKLLTPWQLRQEEALKREQQEAAAAGQPIEPRRPRAGTRGRAMTLRTTKRAKITEFSVCLEFFKESPEIYDTVQKLANRAIRAGVTVPGTEVMEESHTV